MSCPKLIPNDSAEVAGTAAAANPGLAGAIPSEPLPEDGVLEVEDDEDSAFGGSTYSSDSTSISSSIYRGIIENGRRYQTLREGGYWGPSDDKAWESMGLTHRTMLVMDCQQSNPFFRSPIGPNPQNILDIGTGTGDWAIDVADRYPSAVVHGVDLYPPPTTFLPPNCKLEVDDVFKTWMWKEKFDLVHIRWMLGTCRAEQWRGLYKQAFESLAPGGWIEQTEPGVCFRSDDGTLPLDSKLGDWERMSNRIGEKWGHPFNIIGTMKQSLVDAGFVNVKEVDYKIPVGTWPKHKIYKEAGRCNLEQLETGLEGYLSFTLSRWGEPEPFSAEEVTRFCEKTREEMNNKRFHTYTITKRVWAQKPFDEVKA